MRFVSTVVTAWVCALVSLWVIDVGVYLERILALFTWKPLHARVQDFLGVALVHGFFALLLVIIASVAAPAVARVLGRRSASSELPPLLGAGLTFLVAMTAAHEVWDYRYRDAGLPLTVALPLSALAWIVLRSAIKKRDRVRGFGELLQFTFAVPFVIAMLNMAVAQSMHEAWTAVAVHVTGALLAAGFAAGSFRAKSAPGRIALQVTIPVGIVLLAVSSSRTPATERLDRSARSTPSQRPNIVVVVMDTVRADHLRRYGYARDTMPALEQWADGATVFRRAVSPGGWTVPSHASLFSGRPVSLHGVHSHVSRGIYSTRPLEGIQWLPQRLAQYGYSSFAVSSNPLAVSPAYGFDRVVISRRQQWERNMAAGLEPYSGPVALVSQGLRWIRTYLDAKDIVDVIESALPKQDAPVFLFVNFLDAHSPYNPPASALDLLGLEPGHSFNRNSLHPALEERMSRLRPAGMQQDLIDVYDGELRYMDVHLARLFDLIDERLGERTIIVVTADHGEELGEDGHIGHTHGLSQSIVHVPLFVRLPGLEAGEVDELVGVRSVYDFLLDGASGAGTGLSSLLRGDEFDVVSERYPMNDTAPEYERPWVALFEGDLKGVGPLPGEFRLFDLAAQGFSRDVETRDPKGAALESKIELYWASHQDRREAYEAPSPAMTETLGQMKALGYIK
jgi:arylsulfatase A-like enzyme